MVVTKIRHLERDKRAHEPETERESIEKRLLIASGLPVDEKWVYF